MIESPFLARLVEEIELLLIIKSGTIVGPLPSRTNIIHSLFRVLPALSDTDKLIDQDV